ncbi:uncharacterized protein LOC111709620 [Eurytemora carolleeae]|uniref:uncharacterized protein LOC111709620 n=1 Tax=Eurytemora carolleeae TaxID=1294199 RepID=UPI000C786ABE|nr:uncharacterized protein LOC111709620 [Eurytemora carolleeae]|eukprot:XP_023339130.1 uncharacterized protein LOC111709620 [Eurytemora affinis]
MTVTGTVQKHIATLSRQATRESLTLGSLGGSSIVATECGDPACNTNNSILHRKLQDVNIELARNRELVFQEQFLNCSAELKKVDEEVNETTQTYIQESTISIQQSLNTTNQILEQLSLLSSSLTDSGLAQLLPL